MKNKFRNNSKIALTLLLCLTLVISLLVPVAFAYPDENDVTPAETITEAATEAPGAEPPAAEPPELAVLEAESPEPETLEPDAPEPDAPELELYAIGSPTADIATPAAGHYHNAAYAATPAGFRPDFVPEEVKLTAPENAAIFYNKAVIEVTAGASPTQAQIDGVADPTAASTLYLGPVSLAEIDVTHAIVIKAFSFTTLGGTDLSPVATFVYWQRLWVLSDVKEMPEYWTKSQEAWDDNVIALVVSEMTAVEKSQLMSGGQGTTADRLNTRSIGRTAPIHRLCIPATQYVDGPAGVRDGFNSTPFPVAVTIANSWDLEIMNIFATAVAAEATYASYDIMLAPGVNTHRSPLGGRNFEYFSEDPTLAAGMSVQYSKTLHKYGIGEATKHYLANEQETSRSGGNVIVDERALREIYIVPWEKTIKEADPFTIMSSYNRMNGQYVNQNPWAQTQVLRNEFGFKGYIMTDWGANWNTNCYESGNEVRQSGNDLSGIQSYLAAAGQAAQEAARRLAVINQACARILKTNIRTAVFNCVYDGLTQAEVTRRRDTSTDVWYTDEESPYKDSAEVAQKISEAGMVLLQNNAKTLPIAGDSKIALVYDTVATATNTQCGFDYVVQGGGSGAITWERTLLKDVRTSLQEAGFGLPYAVVNSTAGPNATAAAEQAAQAAEVADVGIQIISRLSAEGSDVSTANFNLSNANTNVLNAFSEAFREAGKPFIVVINTGGAIHVMDIIEKADAVIYMGLGGWRGGAALANTLNGKNNPSGKMPDTYSTAYANTVPMLAGKHTSYNWAANPVFYDEGNLVGYRYFDTMFDSDEVLDYVAYPFGYGLSYTEFEFSDLKMSKDVMGKANGDTIEVSVTVKNTGTVAGREVAQLYIGADSYKEEGRPIKELKYFAKTKMLQPGESQTLTFSINNQRDLQYYDDAKGTWNTQSLIRTNLTADPTYNLFNQTVGRVDLWEAQYAANPNLGYTKDGVNGAGWKVAPGTCFTVTVANSSATVGAYAEAFGSEVLTAEFVYGDYASISIPETVDTVSQLVSYDIGVGEVTGANMFEIVAQFDLDLEYEGSVINIPASLNPFFMLEEYDDETGIYKATIGLGKAGALFIAEELTGILSVNFKTKATVADKAELDAYLLSVAIYEVQKSGGIVVRVEAGLTQDSASTTVRTFKRFDIAGGNPSGPDGHINNLDISLILFRYYLMMEGDPNWFESRIVEGIEWAPAVDFDVNADKIVNTGDILIIYTFEC